MVVNVLQYEAYEYVSVINEELKDEKYATHIQVLDCRADMLNLIKENKEDGI